MASRYARRPGVRPKASKVAVRVLQVVRSPSYSPPLLPAAANKLWELARNPAAPLAEVQGLIETEPLIAGEVLKTAQSSFYSRGNPVESLDEAIVRLGVRNVVNIFMTVSAKTTVFKSQRFQPMMSELQVHSSATGRMMTLVCERLGFPADRGFLVGLLHDVGIAACLLVLEQNPQDFGEMEDEMVLDEVHKVHQQASESLAQRWNLSASVRWILGHHHDYRAAGHPNPLATAVCFCDALVTQLGYGGPETFDFAAELEASAEALNLNEPAIEQLRTRGRQVLVSELGERDELGL